MDGRPLPGPLREAAERLADLPGLGPKSALRIALHLLSLPRPEADGLGRAILELRERLCLCDRCGGLAEKSPCALCADPDRDEGLLCLVAEWDSVLAIEEAGLFKGRYLVLGGSLTGSGEGSGGPDAARLKARLAEGAVREVILGLGATLDAEAMASYVKNLVESNDPHPAVTRLAQGIPMGGEVKYIDRETLRQSLLHRQRL